MVWISNGYISAKPLQEIARFLLAANIDLKSWNEDFYRHEIGGDLSSVLETLVRMKKLGVWLEVTTLIIPGVNDSESELQSIAHFIANDLGPETPWHISRFLSPFQDDLFRRRRSRCCTGQRNRDRKRIALCLLRQCARRRRRTHLLLPMPRANYPAFRIPCAAKQAVQRLLPGLFSADRRHFFLTVNRRPHKHVRASIAGQPSGRSIRTILLLGRKCENDSRDFAL